MCQMLLVSEIRTERGQLQRSNRGENPAEVASEGNRWKEMETVSIDYYFERFLL